MTGDTGPGARRGGRAPAGLAKLPLVVVTATILSGCAVAPGGSTEAAAEISLSGYMEKWVGYSRESNNDRAGGIASLGLSSDSEVWLQARQPFGDGAEAGAWVEVDVDDGPNDFIDEAFVFVRGRFGLLQLGSVDNAANKLQIAAPEVGIGINDGDQILWILDPTGSRDVFNDSTLGSTFLTLFDNDVEKISYYTPRLAGVQLGLSYLPRSLRQGPAIGDRRVGYHDGAALGANLALPVAGIDVSLSGGVQTWQAPRGTGFHDPWGVSFGANLGYRGFVLGGSYATIEDARAEHGRADSLAVEGEGFDVGVAHYGESLAASLVWFHGDNAGLRSERGEDRHDTVMLSGSYVLGPGIESRASLFYTEFAGKQSGSADDNSGWSLVTGLTLRF